MKAQRTETPTRGTLHVPRKGASNVPHEHDQDRQQQRLKILDHGGPAFSVS